MKLSALVIGKSHCIASKLRSSSNMGELYVINDFVNPGLSEVARTILANPNDPVAVAKQAASLHHRPDFAVIGSEEPLAKGVVDELAKLGIPSLGPNQRLAKLESSKSFTRELIDKYRIPGNPEFKVFRTERGLEEYLKSKGEFVVKPDGLTGGKGVKVFGDHFSTVSEGLDYCRELFAAGQPAVVIEEKLDGEEFSFQSFFDGEHIAHMIPVQDHKRAFEDDSGPNTGGMGSYSCPNHLLPFLTRDHIREAEVINERVGKALFEETGEKYKGILYGGFMRTKAGIRIIEYNARFGDPEVMNVLSLLETDFVEICKSIVEGTLDRVDVRFRHQASVCKYLVPEGYPSKRRSVIGSEVDFARVLKSMESDPRLHVFYGAVDSSKGTVRLTDSRAAAVVGVADTLHEAERVAETAACQIGGRVYHRRDIGTAKLIQKRIDHMERILGTKTLERRRA